MKLSCILTAANEKDLYLDFIPIFVKTWNKLYPNVDVKIVLISETIPEKFLIYKKNIILFKPIENVLTSFTSQFIRLLYPCILDYKDGVMITDIDMIPMNRSYYTKHIKQFNNNKFIYLRENKGFSRKQISICYNVATPKIWQKIFKINSIEDIRDKLIEISQNNTIKEGHGNEGWSTDQLFLYQTIMFWNKKTNDFVSLKEKITKYNRLNRNKFILDDSIKKNIVDGIYTDYHCYRPMEKYNKINTEIYNLLK